MKRFLTNAICMSNDTDAFTLGNNYTTVQQKHNSNNYTFAITIMSNIMGACDQPSRDRNCIGQCAVTDSRILVNSCSGEDDRVN